MDDAVSGRRTAVAVVLSALLGAAAGVAVTTHPFTDEGESGPKLLGNHQGPPPGHREGPPPGQAHSPGGPGEHARPGWDRGDKEGWRGQDVPPGWWKHDDRHSADRHGKPEKDREHDR